MREVAVRVTQLGKKYRIGMAAQRPDSLREAISEAAGRSLRAMTGRRATEDSTFWALSDVSFEVARGDVLGIIGPNGAGKSTLLKVLSRITEPTTGRVEAYGRVGSLLEVGTGFHPELTGRENVYLNGSILGMRRAEVQRKFDEIVDFSGVERFLDTPVKRYSSGMYVRLAFAVAAHLEPEILVVDEVLAVGDSKFQRKCLGKMKSVASQGRTVLFVSHNLGAVGSLCNKGALLLGGRLACFGATQEALSAYIAINTAAAAGHADFSNRTAARSGPQQYAVLQSLSLFDGAGQLTDTLRMGQPATFRVKIDFKRPGEDYEIGIGISNMHDVYLHYFVSNWEGLQEIPTAGLHDIEVRVPAINLFPGDYQVIVWAKLQGGAYDDGIHEALRFSVQEEQLTSHYAYFQRYSHNTQVYAPSIWKLLN